MVPTIQEVSVPSLSDYISSSSTLSNGIVVTNFEGGTQPVLKIDVVIHTGRYNETAPLTMRTVASLLKEGTSSYSSQEIAEALDFYGVNLKTPILMDTLQYSFYALNKNLGKVVPVIKSMFTEPTFPTSELEIFKQRCIQQFQIDVQKNEVVAFREFTELLFGKEHPYGYNSNVEKYQSIAQQDLLDFHEKHFKAENIEIIVSGRTNDDTIEQLESIFGNIPKGKGRVAFPLINSILYAQKYHTVIEDSHQSALRIGKPIIPKSHPDAPALFITNVILGGYFGSRLMNNIREEKGYTYGIYSQLEQMKYGAYWSVACELDDKYVDDTISEIHKEIHKLSTEPIEKEELDMVRNYLRGTFLQYLDGPMKASELYRELISEDITLAYFEALVQKIESIDAEEIMDIATRYFLDDELLEVVVS